jgi:predicted nucleic acid-binding protein
VTPIFLDTAGLIAWINKDDQWHELARRKWSELIDARNPLITSSLVLVEIGDGLSRIHLRELAVKLNRQIGRSAQVEIVHVTPELQADGWAIFGERADKDWGITDCISFAIMRHRGISKAFTLDHHFEQAGFERLIDHGK